MGRDWENITKMQNMDLVWILIFFFFFNFLTTPQHVDFLGQGSDQNCSGNLHCSCGNNNTESLTHCAVLGFESVSSCYRDNTDPDVPQQEPPDLKKKKKSSCCGSAEMNMTGIHEDAGLIPGLPQGAKDLALP